MYLKDDLATQAIGNKLAQFCYTPLVIYLCGELGAGKTTFARGFLRGLGYDGNVKSPTFSLVESYQFETITVYHLDLYRLTEPAELEFTGIRDLCEEINVVCLIEWPNRGGNATPKPDLVLNFEHSDECRILDISAESSKGQSIIDNL